LSLPDSSVICIESTGKSSFSLDCAWVALRPSNSSLYRLSDLESASACCRALLGSLGKSQFCGMFLFELLQDARVFRRLFLHALSMIAPQLRKSVVVLFLGLMQRSFCLFLLLLQDICMVICKLLNSTLMLLLRRRQDRVGLCQPRCELFLVVSFDLAESGFMLVHGFLKGRRGDRELFPKTSEGSLVLLFHRVRAPACVVSALASASMSSDSRF
ncbi:hypothetical protein PM082_013738, partial [Marasmius tenuissimus]